MHLALRILWFALIGWWISLIWILVATAIALTAIWYNVGLYMIVSTWKVATLTHSPREILAEIGHLF